MSRVLVILLFATAIAIIGGAEARAQWPGWPGAPSNPEPVAPGWSGNPEMDAQAQHCERLQHRLEWLAERLQTEPWWMRERLEPRVYITQARLRHECGGE